MTRKDSSIKWSGVVAFAGLCLVVAGFAAAYSVIVALADAG